MSTHVQSPLRSSVCLSPFFFCSVHVLFSIAVCFIFANVQYDGRRVESVGWYAPSLSLSLPPSIPGYCFFQTSALRLFYRSLLV